MARSESEMKYLAMRAKKMTARMPDVPSPEALRENFKHKGTEISLGEAQELVVIVEKHRAENGIGTSVRSGKAQGKPETKDELKSLAERVSKLESSSSSVAMKTVSRSHGVL